MSAHGTVLLAYTFYCNYDLEEMQRRLTECGVHRWLRRRCDDVDYLTTPAPPDRDRGEGESDLRICVEPPYAYVGQFRLIAWWPTEGSLAEVSVSDQLFKNVFLPVGARLVEEEPPALVSFRARRECTAFGFASELPLAEMSRRLNERTGDLWEVFGESSPQLSATRVRDDACDGLFETRWRLRLDTNERKSHVLEVWHDSNPWNESCWRRSCALARESFLATVDGSDVAELDRHAIDWPEVSFHLAWSFASPLSLEKMCPKLSEVCEGTWHVRDSGLYGDYVSSVTSAPYDEVLKVRVFEEEDRYVLDVRFRSSHPECEAHARMCEEKIPRTLLAAVQATAVENDEGYD